MHRPRMGGALLIVALVAAALAVASPTAAQETGPADVSFTVTAQEADLCEEEYCWSVPVAAIAPNATVNITFENPTGNAEHSFYIMEDGDVSPGAEPDTSEALAGVETLQDGESASTGTFQLPDTEGSLYLWCSVPGHAGLGMYEFLGVGSAAAEGEEGLVAQNVGVPLFSYWVGIIAIFAMFGWLAATFFVLRYQSSHHTDHRDREG